MLQNARVTAFTVSELLRENQQGAAGGGGELKFVSWFASTFWCLIDVPLLINFQSFFSQDILIPTPLPPRLSGYYILGEIPSTTRYIFVLYRWNKILLKNQKSLLNLGEFSKYNSRG